MKSIQLNLLLCLLTFTFCFSQQKTELTFWQPADSLHKKRLTGVIITEAAATTGAFIGLNQLWYANYPKSSFHLVDDGLEWLQMDKAGHLYSGYHLSRIGANILQWAGMTKKNQLIYGAGLGFVLIASVEVFDGYSKEWGASPFDLGADLIGSGMYVAQEILWKEQRIVPKYSFHLTTYATIRPNTLGKSLSEQMLKDYNGQTYWLSCNLKTIFKNDTFPCYLNLAIGYGAEGMITGNETLVNTVFFPEKKQTRQFYLSFDLDLTKIKTKSPLLKTFLSNLNMIKIPAPTLEISDSGKFNWYALYF